MDFSFGTEQLSEAYKNHEFFKELDLIGEIYDSLSFSSYTFVNLATPVMNLDSNFFMSIKGTIKAIRLVFKGGLINDGYTLIRKYYDEVLVYMYQRVYILNNGGPNGKSLEDLFTVPKISDWVKGKEHMPYSCEIEKYLSEKQKTKDLWAVFNAEYFKKIRRFCNDNVHINSFVLMMLNDNERYQKNRERWLETGMSIMQSLFTMHLAFLLYIDYQYLMASDYMDSMDMGLTPPHGSEYWLAPFAQDAFNKYIAPHGELAAFIKKNSPMQIE